MGQRCVSCNEFYHEEFMAGNLCSNCSEINENPFEENDEDNFD